MLSGVPGTILAVAVLVVALAFLVLVWRKGLDRVNAKLGAIHVEVAAVNRAVNNVPKGTPPLPARLDVVESQVDWLVSSLCQLAAALGHELSDPPPSRGGNP